MGKVVQNLTFSKVSQNDDVSPFQNIKQRHSIDQLYANLPPLPAKTKRGHSAARYKKSYDTESISDHHDSQPAAKAHVTTPVEYLGNDNDSSLVYV